MPERPVYRAAAVLEGAVVRNAVIGADGSLYLDLAHRGTDDDACTVVVDPDGIQFQDEDAGAAGRSR